MVQFNGLKNQPQQIYVANNQATQQTDFLVKTNGAKAFTFFFATIPLLNYCPSIYAIMYRFPVNKAPGPYLEIICNCGREGIIHGNTGAVLVMVKQIFSSNDCSKYVLFQKRTPELFFWDNTH